MGGYVTKQCKPQLNSGSDVLACTKRAKQCVTRRLPLCVYQTVQRKAQY